MICGFGGTTWPYPGINPTSTNLDWLIQRMIALGNQVESLQKYIDELQTEISDEVAAALQEAMIPINAQIAEVENSVTQLGLVVSETHTELQSLIAQHHIDVNNLQEQIDNLEFELPDVFNPVKDMMDSLQNTINDLYFNTFDTWISPNEFDALNITPNGFDALNITPNEFDHNAKTILDAAFGP